MIDVTQYKEAVYQIIGAAMRVHSEVGYGLLEPVYQESLFLELKDNGIECAREKEVQIYYKSHQLEKKYRLDMLVGDIIVELKSVADISSAHRLQLCNYLRLTKKPIGLLLNFGTDCLTAERWVYDQNTNKCFLVDRNLQPS